jgi:hypothetical protein
MEVAGTSETLATLPTFSRAKSTSEVNHIENLKSVVQRKFGSLYTDTQTNRNTRSSAGVWYLSSLMSQDTVIE